MTFQRGKRVQPGGQRRTGAQKDKVERRVNRLLLQLIVSAAVFLVVFVGGGLIPDQVYDVFGSVHQVISGDSGLLDSVETLGDAVTEGKSWTSAVREWCVDTFLPAPVQAEGEQSSDFLSASAQFHSHLLPEHPYDQAAAPEGAPYAS